MEIIFLGTSSAVHSYERSHPALVLRAFGEVMLFDCGEGTQRQFIFAKISPMKITKIFISHYHGDHILGLPGLLQSMNFRGREKELTIYGPEGLDRLADAISSLGNSKTDFPINFVEIGTETVEETDEYIVKSQKVNHNTPSLAFSIEEKKRPKFLRKKAIELGVPVGPDFGRLHSGEEVEVDGKIIKPEQVLGPARKGIKITYSGDTTPCTEMIDLAKDSTVLIHESTYLFADREKAEENFHSTSTDAAFIASESNSEKLMLTHFSTRYNHDEIKEMLKEAREVFENTELANDLDTIKIR